MRKYVAPAILVVVLLFAVVLMIDRARVTPEEELDALYRELVQAMADEDKGAMRRLLHPTFAYEGARPMGTGGYDRAFTRLDEFWADTHNTKLTAPKREVIAQGSVGVIKGNGHARFEYSDGMVLYKITFEIAALKAPDKGWQVQSVHFTELAPGLF